MSTEKPIDSQKTPASSPDREEVLAVLFADLCDSTRLYHDLGDAAAHALAAQCLTLIGDVTARVGGTVVKTIGDGAMTTFPTADLAYKAALDIQDALRGGRLRIKIGFHVGPVLVADGDVFGDTVNLAARVLARSGPGEILLTGACVETIRPEFRSAVSLLDTTPVKGKPDPIEIYRVIGEDEENVTIIVAPTKIIERRKAVIFNYRDIELRLDTRGGPLLMGRDAGCRLVVPSEWASRRHATIDVERDRFVLTDHSSNGTYVVEDGGTQQFVKREGVPLSGSGIISLGVLPEENPDDLVRYRYTAGLASDDAPGRK
jgi:class 3 adenylate cyclase